MANGKDSDKMQHNVAFHQGLHCLLRLKQPLGAEMHHNLKSSTFDPLKHTIGSPMLILSYDVESGSEITQCNKIDKPLLLHKKSCLTLLTAMFQPAKTTCINQAIHVLLMHGFCTFHIRILGPTKF